VTEKFYPGLYELADAASNNTQKTFVRITAAYLICVVLGVAANTFLPQTRWAAIVTAVLLLLTLLAPVFMIFRKYADTWYRARALAESIKTSTWKFMMHAEPFNIGDAEARAHFQRLLKGFLDEHKVLGAALAGQSKREQITTFMVEMRKASRNRRRDFYMENRIFQQHAWYGKKAAGNKKSATVWLILMIVFHIVAVVFALCQISNPPTRFPVDLFVVLGSSTLSWMQFKKFSELGAAYALTAQEISIAGEGLSSIGSDEEFSVAVADIENAFSREHTQWAARKDQQ
jgi:hypothetical protein